MRPGPPSAKNMSLTPAAQDLGLGDQLNVQLEDQLAERKKKLLQVSQVPNQSGLNNSPAALSLLGQSQGGLLNGL